MLRDFTMPREYYQYLRSNYYAICRACGAEVPNREPDYRDGYCELCGNEGVVFGVEELFQEGHIELE